MDAIEELLMSRQKEVQELLAQATQLLAKATEICEEEGLEGVSFQGRTFRIHRERWGGRKLRLRTPGWFDEEYWQSSTADCELDTIWDEED